MDRSFVDVLTDELKVSLSFLRQETQNVFKNKQPYRTRKVTDSERIAQYLTMPETVRMKLRQDFPEQYVQYEQKMDALVKEYGNG